MSNFKLIEIRNTKIIDKYRNNSKWIQIPILPLYADEYICFSDIQNFFFDELIEKFLIENDEERIGAISVIAERFPCELYEFLKDNSKSIPLMKLKYIAECVVPSYLPLILPKDKIKDYAFPENYLDDIWVKILFLIKQMSQA